MRLNYAIKFVGDMECRRVSPFTATRSDFGLNFKSPFWSEFETGETTLALHPHPPTTRRAGLKLGLGAPNDLDRLHSRGSPVARNCLHQKFRRPTCAGGRNRPHNRDPDGTPRSRLAASRFPCPPAWPSRAPHAFPRPGQDSRALGRGRAGRGLVPARKYIEYGGRTAATAARGAISCSRRWPA